MEYICSRCNVPTKRVLRFDGGKPVQFTRCPKCFRESPPRTLLMSEFDDKSPKDKPKEKQKEHTKGPKPKPIKRNKRKNKNKKGNVQKNVQRVYNDNPRNQKA